MKLLLLFIWYINRAITREIPASFEEGIGSLDNKNLSSLRLKYGLRLTFC